jgi:YaiO family outer membrane protein
MKNRHGLILLLLAAAQPLWAQNLAADYREGLAARLAGDGARAAMLLERVVAAEPANSDAWIQLGLALLAIDRLDAAEAAFRRTLELAPDYQDARVGLARIAQRRGDRNSALAELDRIAAPAEDARALRAQLENEPVEGVGLWSIDFDLGYAWLEDGQPDWQEGAVRIRRRAADGSAITAAVEASRRFERTDVYGELRVDGRLTPAVDFHLLGGATPGANFRPRWQIGGGLGWRMTGGGTPTVLRFDVRHADYRAGAITTLNPSIEQYLAGRLWLTGQWINLFDARTDRHRMGWLGRADVMASDRLRLFGGLADAPDLSEGVAIDVFTMFGGLAWQASNGIALRLSVARDDRASGSDRTSLTIGLGTAF